MSVSVCLHPRIYVSMCPFACIHVSMYPCVRVSMHLCIYVSVSLCVYARIYVSMHLPQSDWVVLPHVRRMPDHACPAFRHDPQLGSVEGVLLCVSVCVCLCLCLCVCACVFMRVCAL